MGKNRKLRKAEFQARTGLVGELKFTPNQSLILCKIVDHYLSNKSSLVHFQKQYQNIDKEWVSISDSDIGEIADMMERLRAHILLQEQRLKQGLKPTPMEPEIPKEPKLLGPAPAETPKIVIAATIAEDVVKHSLGHELAGEWY